MVHLGTVQSIATSCTPAILDLTLHLPNLLSISMNCTKSQLLRRATDVIPDLEIAVRVCEQCMTYLARPKLDVIEPFRDL